MNGALLSVNQVILLYLINSMRQNNFVKIDVSKSLQSVTSLICGIIALWSYDAVHSEETSEEGKEDLLTVESAREALMELSEKVRYMRTHLCSMIH